MVNSHIISEHEGSLLKRKVEVEGNVAAMNELLTMVNLRRGGFDAFLSALRCSDYVWIAEQLDPGKAFTGDSTGSNAGRNSTVQNLVTSMRQRISRKSEPAIMSTSQDDILYTSYRDDCPMNIPINPSYYTNLNPNGVDRETEKDTDSSSSSSNMDKDALQLLESLTLKSKLENEVIIHNVNPENSDMSEEVYIKSLAKKASVPSPLIHELRVISKGKVCKTKMKSNSKVKLRFDSETCRNRFFEHMQYFIAHLEPTDALYPSLKDIKVSIPQRNSLQRFKTIRTKCRIGSMKLRNVPFPVHAKVTEAKEATESEQTSSSSSTGAKRFFWYQKSFRFRPHKSRKP